LAVFHPKSLLNPIFQVLILSDLECDYINAQQCCSKLNFWSIPKVSAHVLVTLLLLITGHWILFLVNVPFVGYLLWEYRTIPRGNIGIFDPAEIHVSELKTPPKSI
jgi:protein cornichon